MIKLYVAEYWVGLGSCVNAYKRGHVDCSERTPRALEHRVPAMRPSANVFKQECSLQNMLELLPANSHQMLRYASSTHNAWE